MNPRVFIQTMIALASASPGLVGGGAAIEREAEG
jgi:hypothetical protein